MSSSPTETTVAVHMPQMGISVSEGTILEWRKSVGDAVVADEPICDVTTDKVDVEIPCPAAGVLARIVAEVGETVPVGEAIAEIDVGSRNGSAAGPVAEEGEPSPTPPAGEADRSSFVSPVVRRIAAEHSVDLGEVEGHGVGGRVRKKDLLAFIEGAGNGEAAATTERPLHIESPYVPDAPAEVGGRREEMSPMRKAIAEHMVRSRHTAAHVTTVAEVDFSSVAARRAELKEAYARRGVPLTYLAFVARAVVEALEEFPVLNASVDGEEIVYHDDVNLGIAVALDEISPLNNAGAPLRPSASASQGLIVPVIPRAQRLSLEGLAAAIADVAERARARKLDPDEVHGGTFTITNPGQFGAVIATPIINQPQVGILDLEAIQKRPVVIERDGEDLIAIRPMAFLPLSFDHRALDGATAARFLARVKDLLERGDRGTG